MLETKIAECKLKIAECNEINMPNDKYESSNIASQKKLRSISGNINLNRIIGIKTHGSESRGQEEAA